MKFSSSIIYHENRRILIKGEEYNYHLSVSASVVVAYWSGISGIDEQGEAPVRVRILFDIL